MIQFCEFLDLANVEELLDIFIVLTEQITNGMLCKQYILKFLLEITTQLLWLCCSFAALLTLKGRLHEIFYVFLEELCYKNWRHGET